MCRAQPSFLELLKDETLDMDLITPTLPALKSLLTIEIREGAYEPYNKLIHGLLSSCLLNIDDMRWVYHHKERCISFDT